MMETYIKLLNDKEKIWSNMIAVITKISWRDDDYDELEDWIVEMDDWKQKFKEQLSKRYDGADPFILAIS